MVLRMGRIDLIGVGAEVTSNRAVYRRDYRIVVITGEESRPVSETVN